MPFISWQELIEQSQIVDIHDVGEVTDSRDGYIRRLGFRTAAGYAYAALVGVPYKQETEIPVMYTTAWWTSTEGHNERTARNLMRLGNVVMMVGAEGSWHDGRLSKPETKITLSGSAAATLNFTQEVIDDYKYLASLNSLSCSAFNSLFSISWRSNIRSKGYYKI